LDKEEKRRFNEVWLMKNIATQSDALHTPDNQRVNRSILQLVEPPLVYKPILLSMPIF